MKNADAPASAFFANKKEKSETQTFAAAEKRKFLHVIPAGATEPYLRMFSNVQVLRLAHPPAERTFYLVTPKGRALSAAAETLLEDLRVQIQDLEGITWY